MIAKLHIETVLKDGITCLKQSYCTAPFKVANITEDKTSAQLHLMLMCSSPGILDGDEYELKIEMGENSSLQLHTQSYQRLFNMKKGARQLMEVYLKKGSSFVYLPHPSVPHENSVFTVANKFFLNAGCRLMWGEVLTCGRKLSKGLSKGVSKGVLPDLPDLSENGEVFRFSKYHSITEVFMNDRLVIKENLLMQPAVIDPAAIGQLEGFTHQASFIFLEEKTDCTDAADTIHEYLSLQNEIVSGITTAPANGLIIRLLGYKAEQLHDHLKAVARILSKKTKTKNSIAAYAG
jgi:urease accessory protein